MNLFSHKTALFRQISGFIGADGMAHDGKRDLLRLFCVVLAVGIGFGTLAGMAAAGHGENRVLVQGTGNPDLLTVMVQPSAVDMPFEITELKPPVSGTEKPVVQSPAVQSIDGMMDVEPDAAVTASIVIPARATIALVIDDLGLHHGRTREIADLGVPLTMAFLPYAEYLREQTSYALSQGHQIFAHVPMQPGGDEDPGPEALTVDLKMDEIRSRLDHQLADFVGLSGINNHMGSRFTSDRASMEMFISEVADRDLLFLDSLTSAASQGARLAGQHGLPVLRRDFFIDHDAKGNPELIDERMQTLLALALERGQIIAIGHPYPGTIAGLKALIPQAQSMGVEFVTIDRLLESRIPVLQARRDNSPDAS